jgi:hypothetical protein
MWKGKGQCFLLVSTVNLVKDSGAIRAAGTKETKKMNLVFDLRGFFFFNLTNMHVLRQLKTQYGTWKRGQGCPRQ